MKELNAVIASSPLGPSLGSMTERWGMSGAPSLAGSNSVAMAAASGNMTAMMQYNHLAYQSLMGRFVQVLGGLMNSSPNGTSSYSPPSTDTNSSNSASDSGNTDALVDSSSGGGGVDPSQFSGGTDNGRKLAAAAKAEASNGDSSGGLCYRDVCRSLKSIGVNCSGESAYMAADQLAQNPKVREIKVSQADLAQLPPGAIVVWDRGPGESKKHGHISVSTGDGKEASDLMRNQITNYGTSFRVFMPV